MIPKEIQDRIVKRGNAIDPFHTSSRTYTREGDFKTGFFEGGQYGYTIRDDEVQSLKDEVERLKGLVDVKFFFIHRDIFVSFLKTLSKDDFIKEHFNGFMYEKTYKSIIDIFKQFKQQNNL